MEERQDSGKIHQRKPWMALLFYSREDDPDACRRELRSRMPDLEVRVWPEIGNREDIEAALVWRPPAGLLAGLPNLRAVFSLGAGVDGLLEAPDLPDVPLCRMVDPTLTRSMVEYALCWTLFYHRRLDIYDTQQRRGEWNMRMPQPAGATRVGVMGLGELGRATAEALVRAGFSVRGWSRTPKNIPGVESYALREQLPLFLRDLDIVICLLPLTPETENILDAELFRCLPEGACLVHLARGRHLVERDLMAAIERGHLRAATVDVFRTEPLPPDHPFWRHPGIHVTPHVASYALPETGAEVIVENLRRLRQGRPLLHRVSRQRGY